jgi:hypothetical protein
MVMNLKRNLKNDQMKVISLLQPWATLVVIGAKKIETRSWNTKFTGPLLIHASANKKLAEEVIYKFPFNKVLVNHFNRVREPAIEDLPFGAIIGSVDMVATFSTNDLLTQKTISKKEKVWHLTDEELAFGDYSCDRYGWLLENAQQFAIPIPAKGSLSLWDYDLPDHFHLPVAGGHATFSSPPTQETLFAVEKMAQLAYKKLKK